MILTRTRPSPPSGRDKRSSQSQISRKHGGESLFGLLLRDETIAIFRLVEIPCLVEANRSNQLR